MTSEFSSQKSMPGAVEGGSWAHMEAWPMPPSGSGLRAARVVGKSKEETVGNRPSTYTQRHTVWGARGPLAWGEDSQGKEVEPFSPPLPLHAGTYPRRRKKNFLATCDPQRPTLSPGWVSWSSWKGCGWGRCPAHSSREMGGGFSLSTSREAEHRPLRGRDGRMGPGCFCFVLLKFLSTV